MSVDAVEQEANEFVDFWREILVPKFVKYRHVLVGGLSHHSEKVFPSLAVKAGDKAIDVGCGFGDTAMQIAEIVGPEGSVLGMGVFIGQSTKIVDRETGEVMYGEVPAGSVVVAGSMPSKGGVNLYCAVIVKKVDEKTRGKVGINELLRDI